MIIKYRIWIPDAPMNYGEDMYYQGTQYLSSFLRRVYAQYGVGHPSHLDFQVEDRLMMFTGLIDKNGKEIYKSDLVKNKYGEITEVKWTSDLTWWPCSNTIEGNSNWDNKEEFEVVGNIYDRLGLD